MLRKFTLCLCLTAATLFAVQAVAQDVATRNPSSPDPAVNESLVRTIHPPAKSVKVLLLKSWGTTSVWEDLKTNWNKYGKIPLNIDDSTYINSDFTYENLVQSGANVIVMSDPAGGIKQYSSTEIAAVLKYARKGHTAIGTYLVFQWATTDNRGLAPAFGLLSSLTYNTTAVNISNDFHKTASKQCLLNKIPGTSWMSQGYAETQTPEPSMSWKGHLGHAKAVAEVDTYLGVISVYKAKTYTGVYVSNFPEYNGGTDDEQLLYNASTCYVK